MKNNDNQPAQASSSSLKQRQALRRRAEKLAREKESLSPSGPQAVSQEETQKQLHELLVHQIELEMQNDELRRAQAELEEARERYLDLYEFAPVGYCTLTEDGMIQQVNLTATNLLGVPRGALIGQSITCFIHKAEQDTYYLNKLRLFEIGEPQSYELRMARRDGTSFWANLATNILQDADGELKCRVVISDITEKKLVEEALRESEERLRTLTVASAGVVYRMSLDWTSMTELYGKGFLANTEEPNSNWLDKYIHPDDQEFVTGVIHECIRERKMFELEHRVLQADGSVGWTYSRAIPLLDGNGEIREWFGMASDITQRKCAEEALRESEERLRTLTVASAGVVYRMSLDWTSMTELYGKGFLANTEEPNSNWLNKYIHPDDQEFVTGVIHECIRERKMFELEHRVLQADGSVGWTYSRAIPLLDGNGEIKEWFGMASDITQRKCAEEALRDSEGRIRVLVNSMLDEVWFADKDKMVTLVNPAVLREFGEASHGDSVDKIASSFEVYRPDGSPRPVEEAPPLRALGGEVVRNQEEIVRIPARDELRYRQVNASPVIDIDGNIIGSVSIVRDITEQKRVEVILRDNETRLTELSRNLAAEVDTLRLLHQIDTRYIRQEELHSVYRGILDAAMSLTGADCGILQLAVDEGQALEIAVNAGLSEAFVQYFQRVSNDKTACAKALEDRARVIVNDVSVSPVFDDALIRRVMLEEGIQCVQSTPMFSGAGNFMGVFSTHYKSPHEFDERELRVFDLLARQASDVIERVKIEEALQDSESRALALAMELEKKNRFVTDFFINISHELKTPITLIMLALDIIENYLRQPELNRAGITNRIAIMKQNANRLSRLVSNILDITKIDAGFMEPKLAVVDVVQLIHSLVESMESFALKKRLQIEFTSSAETKQMPADSQIIERIILNLVSNAIKHTQDGGKILISFLNKGSKITISVKDNGEGIPDEKKGIIFDRFRQVNTSFTRSNEGSGVGLSLIKALVELLGGHIWFESILGEGSEFFVELPVLQMEEKNQLVEQLGMTIDRRIEMEFSDIS